MLAPAPGEPGPGRKERECDDRDRERDPEPREWRLGQRDPQGKRGGKDDRRESDRGREESPRVEAEIDRQSTGKKQECPVASRAATFIARQYGLPLSQKQLIPFADLSREHAAIAGELDEALRRLVGSSSFTLGEEVERFEQEFAAYCGVEHCIGVASGTAALSLTLIAAGVGRGDEVIVPAHTFIASALGVLHAGATPVLCDVEEGTGLIDPESAAACLSARTAAILPVHLYGQLCDMGALHALAERHGLFVLEDAAQAHGASEGASRAGALGRAGAFSFYPSKNLGALGDAGAITTRDPEIARRARELRNLGQRAKGEHVVAGFNERLDGLQAAFLGVKLRHLDRWNAARRTAASAYREALGDDVVLLEDRGSCVYHLFPVKTPTDAA